MSHYICSKCSTDSLNINTNAVGFPGRTYHNRLKRMLGVFYFFTTTNFHWQTLGFLVFVFNFHFLNSNDFPPPEGYSANFLHFRQAGLEINRISSYPWAIFSPFVPFNFMKKILLFNQRSPSKTDDAAMKIVREIWMRIFRQHSDFSSQWMISFERRKFERIGEENEREFLWINFMNDFTNSWFSRYLLNLFQIIFAKFYFHK